jgi:hypothetical protein
LCSSKALFSINLLAKIRTRKNKSWMESLSLHMVYWLGTAMPSSEDLIELALWWAHLHIQGIGGNLQKINLWLNSNTGISMAFVWSHCLVSKIILFHSQNCILPDTPW